MKRFTLLLILACLSPYGVAQEVPLYESITDNVPKIGVTTEVYLGDRMLEQRTGEYRECVIPKENHEVTYRDWASLKSWTIKAKQPLCKKDADSKYYFPSYDLVQDQGVVAYINLVEIKGNYEMHICREGMRCPRKLRFTDLKINTDITIDNTYFLYNENTLQQTIEYAGKSGNILKFLYSEFYEGMARDAFNREFQVDLSEGNVLAFKGALIEIESASNINILYKVIRNFRD